MSTPRPLSRVRDCAVVGGGVAGCTITYELARHGLSVSLFEQRNLAHAASGRNMGLLLNQVEAGVAHLMQRSLDAYREVEPALDFGLRRVDQLLLASNEDQMALAKARADSLRGLGIRVDLLGAAEVRSQLPYIASDVSGGALVNGSWAVDPALATRAFAEAARAAGAGIHTGVRVAAVQADGVVTDAGTVAADIVVVASGPWLPELVAGLPITAARGWLMRLPSLPFSLPWVIEEMSWPDQDELGRSARSPTIAEVAAGAYDRPAADAFVIAPIPGGGALLGTSLVPSLLYACEGAEMPRRTAERALKAAPGLRDVPIGAAWYGLRPMAPDGLPLAGKLPGGIWIHGGHGSLGMQSGPATARWLADSIRGVVSPELERFSPSRFEP